MYPSHNNQKTQAGGIYQIRHNRRTGNHYQSGDIFVCADLLGFHEIPVSVFCFFVAATQNYFINHKWSFKRITKNAAPGLKQWALFTGASLAGLGVNIAVMKSFILGFNPPYKCIAQACGIAAGMGINFWLSKRVVFRGKRVQK
jgi:putative flippase GtrA